jgi:hypothetical protein
VIEGALHKTWSGQRKSIDLTICTKLRVFGRRWSCREDVVIVACCCYCCAGRSVLMTFCRHNFQARRFACSGGKRINHGGRARVGSGRTNNWPLKETDRHSEIRSRSRIRRRVKVQIRTITLTMLQDEPLEEVRLGLRCTCQPTLLPKLKSVIRSSKLADKQATRRKTNCLPNFCLCASRFYSREKTIKFLSVNLDRFDCEPEKGGDRARRKPFKVTRSIFKLQIQVAIQFGKRTNRIGMATTIHRLETSRIRLEKRRRMMTSKKTVNLGRQSTRCRAERNRKWKVGNELQ